MDHHSGLFDECRASQPDEREHHGYTDHAGPYQAHSDRLGTLASQLRLCRARHGPALPGPRPVRLVVASGAHGHWYRPLFTPPDRL